MANITTEEGQHTLPDGKKLYTKTWRPSGTVKAYLVFLHGFSDHCNNYDNLFDALAAKNIEVRAYDQRGWGMSVTNASEKGVTGYTPTVMADMTSFLSTLIPSRPVPSAPVFLMGASMGGQETLTYAAIGPSNIRQHIRGYLVDAPWIGLDPKTQPNAMTVFVGRLAGKLIPHYKMYNPLEHSFLSRDPETARMVKEDELCHDTGTLEGMAGALDRAANLRTGKVRLGTDAGEGGKTRLWVGHGTGDKICSFEATKQWYGSLGDGIEDKELKEYDGWYHMLHRDNPGKDREDFANDVASWILARSGPA